MPSPAGLLLVFLAACGSGGADSGPSEPGGGKVLFVGPARRLVPHEEGRSALFRVTATTGGATTTTALRTRVASDDGTSFVVEQRAEDGSESRLHARDVGAEIRAEAVVDGDGVLRAVDPAAVLVRTPVVAGEPVQGGFQRSLAVVLRGTDGDVRVVVPFEGTSERTPLGLDEDGAIRFGVVADGAATVPTAVGTIGFRLRVTGEESLAPDVGLVREELDLELRAGSGTATAHLSTLRMDAP
ncbi:MAG: hypothetical protein ACKPBU_12570 [Alphaproteobacteria bacterium]